MSRMIAPAFCLALTVIAACNQTSSKKHQLAGEKIPIDSLSGQAKSAPAIGKIEILHKIPASPAGVTVASDGRIFATINPYNRGKIQLAEMAGANNYKSFPHSSWNQKPDEYREEQSDGHMYRIFTPYGILIDGKSRLWVVDNGNKIGIDQHYPPKIMAFDVMSRIPKIRYVFPAKTGPLGGFMKDIAVDAVHEWVFVADAGGVDAKGRTIKPAIVGINIGKNVSRRFEASDALQSENIDIMIEGSALRHKGRPARIGVSSLLLSPDNETLYFSALNSHTLYSVPAKLFRDSASDALIAASVKKAGAKPVSEGMTMDTQGNFYFSNIENQSIDVIDAQGNATVLVKDTLLKWPTRPRFGPDGWLYFGISQMNRTGSFNGEGVNRSESPYVYLRVYAGKKGMVGR